MGYSVFMLKPDSIYDDFPAERYQFPKQYLGRAQHALGDWIVYLEPKKVPRSRGYFAIARVEKIVPDPSTKERHLALIEPGSYLEFSLPVPFNVENEPVERGLLNDKGGLSGRAQAAVRPISPQDFLRIIELGLGDSNPVLPRMDEDAIQPGLADVQAKYFAESERDRISHFVSRPVRDRAFRGNVLRAYDSRCAITGLKFINGGGRAEVDAAHIRPVEHNGPDSIHNGLALSGTAHWMFDRGLISLSDDLEILVSRQANDPEGVRSFINKSGRAIPPLSEAHRPHPNFLAWHRQNCFKA